MREEESSFPFFLARPTLSRAPKFPLPLLTPAAQATFTCNDVVSIVYRWKSFHTRTSLSAKNVVNLVICGGKVHLLREK